MTSTPSKATAGPWCVPAGDGNELIVCEGDDPKNPGRILFVFRHPVGTKPYLPYEEMAANCRLSAAAPDLVAALIAAKQEMWMAARGHWTMSDFKNWAIVQQIDAALEKADGTPRTDAAFARAAISRAAGEA